MNSHFITRLAFCYEDDKTKWFINQESRLFKARISEFSIIEKQTLANLLKIQFQILTPNEYKQLETELRYAVSRKFPKKSKQQPNFDNFYKVKII